MLNNHERHVLGEVERNLRSDDPEFVARLGDEQQRLPSTRSCRAHRFRFSFPVVSLGILVVGLLVLGLSGPAVLVAVLAAGAGWLSAARIDAERGKR
jgi:TRAP-type mannitol/chloroaromatic compound transport system permease large subunit